MSDVPAIGIDLGTTFSCVSVYKNGKPELIPNDEGDRLTPSIVYFNARTGEARVGDTAEDLLAQFPKNGLLDAKRFIGRKFEDEFISRYKHSNQVHFLLVRGADGQAAFEIEVADRKIIKSPEEVSAEVLKYLKRTASNYLGVNITKAVISVPAYFSNAQRKATKKAAELAGLTVLKLLTEPTAAAIHYVSDKNRENSNILAFDFGGGTLDVSLIKVINNRFEVKAVYGDTLLGGRNFDEILFEYFYKNFLKTKNKHFQNEKFKRDLSNLCTYLKKKLSTNEEYTLHINRYDGNPPLELSMTRAKFEEICDCIFRRIIHVVELCLGDSGFAKSDINEVILVGGSSRIPKIHELLSSYFGQEKIRTDLNPEEAVAAGASIHADFLLGNCQDLEKYKVTEVTPMSLGIGTVNALMSVVIPRNTAIPASANGTYTNTINDGFSAAFPIYEGERKNIIYNNKLGTFSITNLPKGRSGDVKFSVHFNLDEDGILSVEAKENSTGQSNKLVVTMGQFRLSEKRIQASLEDFRMHKNEDDVFEKFHNCKQKLQQHCHHIQYDLHKISSKEDQDFVKLQCEEFLGISRALQFTEIEELEAKFVAFKNSVSDILMKNLMLELKFSP